MSDTNSKDSVLPDEDQLISCELCLKSVPISEAEVSEAEEYVAYFCGLECYDSWIKQKKDKNTA